MKISSEHITAWLSGKQLYSEGLELFERLSDKDFLKKMFRKGEDSFNRKKIVSELKIIAENLKQTEAARVEQMPPELKVRQLDAQDLMNERSELKAMLRFMVENNYLNEEKIKPLAFRIIEIRDNLDEIFGTVALFKEHGVLPEPEEQEAITFQTLYNLRTYVSKYTGCLVKGITVKGRTLKTSKRVEYENKLAELKLRAAFIEKQLLEKNVTFSN